MNQKQILYKKKKYMWSVWQIDNTHMKILYSLIGVKSFSTL
jgi:hypothetical protein